MPRTADLCVVAHAWADCPGPQDVADKSAQEATCGTCGAVWEAVFSAPGTAESRYPVMLASAQRGRLLAVEFARWQKAPEGSTPESREGRRC